MVFINRYTNSRNNVSWKNGEKPLTWALVDAAPQPQARTVHVLEEEQEQEQEGRLREEGVFGHTHLHAHVRVCGRSLLDVGVLGQTPEGRLEAESRSLRSLRDEQVLGHNPGRRSQGHSLSHTEEGLRNQDSLREGPFLGRLAGRPPHPVVFRALDCMGTRHSLLAETCDSPGLLGMSEVPSEGGWMEVARYC